MSKYYNFQSFAYLLTGNCIHKYILIDYNIYGKDISENIVEVKNYNTLQLFSLI